jgi:hypothetical protein
MMPPTITKFSGRIEATNKNLHTIIPGTSYFAVKITCTGRLFGG